MRISRVRRDMKPSADPASNGTAIQMELQRLLGVSVDVLTHRALPDGFRSAVLAEAVPP